MCFYFKSTLFVVVCLSFSCHSVLFFFYFWCKYKLYKTEPEPKRNISLLAAFFVYFFALIMRLAEGDLQYNPAEWLDFIACKTFKVSLTFVCLLWPLCGSLDSMFLWPPWPISQNYISIKVYRFCAPEWKTGLSFVWLYSLRIKAF